MPHPVTSIILVVGLLVPASAQPPATQSSSAPAALARVLRYVPDDAHLVLVIPSIDGVAAGLSAFGKAIDVPDIAELNARTLLEKTLDESASAVDTSGALIVALSARHDEPVLIATLKNEESWRASTQPSALEDGAIYYEFGPDRLVATTVKGVAIFGREKSELRRGLAATGELARRLEQEAGALMQQRQAIVYADVQAWSDELESRLGLVSQAMSMGMLAAGPDAEASLQVWNFLLERLKHLVGDARTYVGTLRIDGGGLFVDSRATFRPNCEVAQYLAQVHPLKRDLLRGLPAGQGPIVLSYEWDQDPGVEGFDAAMAKALLNIESIRQRVGGDKLEAMVKQSLELNSKVSGTSAVFSFDKGLMYSGIYLTARAADVQRDLERICELTPELLSGAWGTLPGAMKRCPDAQIGGVTTDVYELNVDAENSPHMAAAAAIYGKNPALYLAQHPQGMAYAFGPRDEARVQIELLLTPSAAPLSQDPRVVDLFKVLTPNAQLCAMFDIPRLVRTGMHMLDEVGMPAPRLELPDSPPVWAGFAFYLDPQRPRIELFVPAAPLKALVKAAREIEHRGESAY